MISVHGNCTKMKEVPVMSQTLNLKSKANKNGFATCKKWDCVSLKKEQVEVNSIIKHWMLGNFPYKRGILTDLKLREWLIVMLSIRKWQYVFLRSNQESVHCRPKCSDWDPTLLTIKMYHKQQDCKDSSLQD